ncbi:MAG: GDP-mannose 4,6-dehydratase, partial [Candidatus Thermoplasmatota archaeon]|nr:GDP-mannose 4,6-dehydratase [Candidatus Thermoplasmatota archaeon]
EVSDVVSLILQILADQNNVPNDVYNVATQTETSILELLQLISKSVTEIDPSIPIPKVNHQGKRSGDIDISLADIAKVKSAFNWQPKQSIEEGIASLVAFELGS